jgi:hypothetical protein
VLCLRIPRFGEIPEPANGRHPACEKYIVADVQRFIRAMEETAKAAERLCLACRDGVLGRERPSSVSSRGSCD